MQMACQSTVSSQRRPMFLLRCITRANADKSAPQLANLFGLHVPPHKPAFQTKPLRRVPPPVVKRDYARLVPRVTFTHARKMALSGGMDPSRRHRCSGPITRSSVGYGNGAGPAPDRTSLCQYCVMRRCRTLTNLVPPEPSPPTSLRSVGSWCGETAAFTLL